MSSETEAFTDALKTVRFEADPAGPRNDPEAAVSNIRRQASGRQHALKTWHPDAGRVDAETFWLVWRDGVNWALTASAKMSTLFQEVGEQIMLMSQARDAAPRTCPHCGSVLEDAA